MKTPAFLRKPVFDNSINLLGRGVVGIIDIGSAGGIVSEWEHRPALIKNLLRIEPRDKGKTSRNIIDLNTCIWEKNVTKVFNIYKGFDGRGSSLFSQNFDYVKKRMRDLKNIGDKEYAKSWFERSALLRKQKMKCKTLDAVLDEIDMWGRYDLLKIDTQGAEYQILRGAKRYLKNDCCAVFLETFRIPLYKGIKLYPDIKMLLQSYDFELVKKFPPHGTFDSQNDCLFIKRGAHGPVIETIKEIYKIE